MDELKPEDVMKALECCMLTNEQQECRCEECPLWETSLMVCQELLAYHALALLREKDAEIYELRKTMIEVHRLAMQLRYHDVPQAYAEIRRDTINEFAERLKEAPIKCGLPLLGLQTKGEIEEYFNGIMLQVRDAIDGIAEELKGEQQ